VQSASVIVAIDPGRCLVSTLQQPADIPEEQIWLELEERAHAPRLPVRRAPLQHLMRTLSITTPAELRQADHKGVIARERFMRETERAAASTIRRRLAGLSSL
jgi:hypothetical protein